VRRASAVDAAVAAVDDVRVRTDLRRVAFLAALFAVATATAALAGPAIVERPIRFGADRVRLTVEYRQRHQDPQASDAAIVPQLIILHHTGGASLKSAWATFDAVRAADARPELGGAGEVNVSAHYLVDRDGTIYRLMPDTVMARHCIGLNHVAIGIENVGEPKSAPLTPQQVEADAALVRDLVARFPTIRTLIGHHEYRGLEKTPLFLERDRAYRNRKPDPGPAFMSAVRAKVADLHLEGPPAP
jgi:hypothetical protein